MAKYSIVFSDLDGTLLDSRSMLSSENKSAIEYLHKIGVPFVPATGRQVRSLPDEIKNNPYIRYCITSNGVEIYDLKEKKTVSKVCMPCGIVDDFFALYRELGEPGLEVYYKSAAYITEEYYNDPAGYNNPRVEYIQTTRTPVPDLYAFAKQHEDELDGLTFIAPKGRLLEIAEKVRTRFPGIYVTTADGIYVETANIECGKHNGMKRLCRILGIDMAETVAFGDNDNDIEMVTAAGLGAAMKNATDNLKKAADVQADTNDDDGVAKLIYKLFPQKEKD